MATEEASEKAVKGMGLVEVDLAALAVVDWAAVGLEAREGMVVRYIQSAPL